MKKVTDTIFYVGADDTTAELFEAQYTIPNGMAYNSYVIMDEKIAVMDTIDEKVTSTWLANLDEVLGDKQPDYLVCQHMEPDHSANILTFIDKYPNAKIVGNAKTFCMMHQFFDDSMKDREITVKDGDTLELGKHTLKFVFAPMVHWPEVMVTYDMTDKILFSADAFGKFGAVAKGGDWKDEARRYYIGIVGKYGMQVMALLKKAAALDIQIICPLHGPVLTENLSYYIDLYTTWASYVPEEEGVLIAYSSVYGNTEKAAKLLADMLKERGKTVSLKNLVYDDMAEAVSDAFRFSKVVLATTTYNMDIFPVMRTFIDKLTERGFKNRTVGMIENGTWAPAAANVMKKKLEACKDITYLDSHITIRSAMHDDTVAALTEMADALAK